MKDKLTSRQSSSRVRRPARRGTCHESCLPTRYGLTGFENQISLAAPVTKVARPAPELSHSSKVLGASLRCTSTSRFEVARTAQTWKLPVPPAAIALRPWLIGNYRTATSLYPASSPSAYITNINFFETTIRQRYELSGLHSGF
jgi:hypothetical protein